MQKKRKKMFVLYVAILSSSTDLANAIIARYAAYVHLEDELCMEISSVPYAWYE
jgi:hypothetical protein